MGVTVTIKTDDKCEYFSAQKILLIALILSC